MKIYTVLCFTLHCFLFCIITSNAQALEISTNNGLFSEDLFNRLFDKKYKHKHKHKDFRHEQKTSEILITFKDDLETQDEVKKIETKYQLKVYSFTNENLNYTKTYHFNKAYTEICADFKKIKSLKKCEITNP